MPIDRDDAEERLARLDRIIEQIRPASPEKEAEPRQTPAAAPPGPKSGRRKRPGRRR